METTSTFGLTVALVTLIRFSISIPIPVEWVEELKLPPVVSPPDLNDPDETPAYINTNESVTCNNIATEISGRNGLTNIFHRWATFNVQLDPTYDDRERKVINKALWELGLVLPCVRFAIYPEGDLPSGDYVYMKKEGANGCSSRIGKQMGINIINLHTKCMRTGKVMHELIHALGVDHEQNRQDRDEHVIIHWENIRVGLDYNFEKVSGISYDTYGVPYNTRSIMHYGNYAFSSNKKPVITDKNNPNATVGSELKLQDTDKQRLKRMYGC